MITDEMVEKALSFMTYTPRAKAELTATMRAVLEAVAPMLRKQAMLELCNLYEARCRAGKAEPWTENFSALYARAQELDPK